MEHQEQDNNEHKEIELEMEEIESGDFKSPASGVGSSTTIDDQFSISDNTSSKPPISLNSSSKPISTTNTFNNRVDFSFKAINHYVTVPFKGNTKGGPTTVNDDNNGKRKSNKKTISKQILTDINGHVKSGEMCAIMGPSGAGKTTLLDILAHRLPINGSGTMYINETKSEFQVFKKLCGYVTQADILTPSMTVRETLSFYAQLKMPRSVSIEEKNKRVDDVIAEMGLKRCENTVVGTADNKIRGISGGERRRVTIAVELLTGPSVLFLDEPTSGLDSSTAYTVMKAVRNLANSGRTIICTIHQPRYNIFDMFDSLLLLGEGSTIYYGEASLAIKYFNRHGHHCHPSINPADFFMDLINVQIKENQDDDDYDPNDIEMVSPDISSSKVVKRLTTEEIHRLKKEYSISEECTITKDYLEAMEQDDKKNKKQFTYVKNEPPTFWTQLTLLVQRELLNAKRHPMAFRVQFFQAIFQGLLCGLVYYQLGVGQSSIQSRTGVVSWLVMGISFPAVMTTIHVFTDVVPIFLKDRASGVYDTLPFFLAKSIMDVSLAIILPVITGTIAYWMTNQRIDPFFAAAPFFKWLLCLVMACQTCLSLGVLISSSVPNAQVGTVVAPLIVILFFLFSGFFINYRDLARGWVFMKYISFFRYIIEPAVINTFTGVVFTCTAQEAIQGICPVQTGEQVINNLGYELNNFWRDIWVLVIYIIGFRCLTFLVLRIKSRDKFVNK
ncbi:hypothetical protein CYY_005695 [Polysphondylium violaceum]|uniref:ABC transporter domain-containing protein n=1 Tax=Polysphondylium violaceum TaxID=133409 RepID=A0A8J4PSG9_9MYCE|nr:hypothetical protein CYY_005695 [Polysphondylium violaceum]